MSEAVVHEHDNDLPPFMWRWLPDAPYGYRIGPHPPHTIRFAQCRNHPQDFAVRGPSRRWHSLDEAVAMGWLERVDAREAAWMRFVAAKTRGRR